MRFLILAREKSDGDSGELVWSMALQTNDVNEALEFWQELPQDTSDRIMLDTDLFVSFKPGEPVAD